MKTPLIIALLILGFTVQAQQQTTNRPPLQRNEAYVMVTSTIEQTAASEVAVVAAMDTTKNLDTLIKSKDLIYTGRVVVFNMKFANSTDSVKFTQYNYLNRTWEACPITYKKRNASLASVGTAVTAGADTTAIGGWASPVGANLNIGLSLDYCIANRTNGDIRIQRGSQDTGKVKIGYIKPGRGDAAITPWVWR